MTTCAERESPAREPCQRKQDQECADEDDLNEQDHKRHLRYRQITGYLVSPSQDAAEHPGPHGRPAHRLVEEGTVVRRRSKLDPVRSVDRMEIWCSHNLGQPIDDLIEVSSGLAPRYSAVG